MSKCEQLDYTKKKRKHGIKKDAFCFIPGFSQYVITKEAKLKDLSTGKIYPPETVKASTMYLRNDAGKTVGVDAIFLLSQMAYGPNDFPLLEIDDDYLMSDEFTAEDVKVDLLKCFSTFYYISEYEFEMCNVVFRKYLDTPLYVTQYGNIFNAATGMMLKLPQRNGYYTLTAFYGGYRVQRMVYEAWKDDLPDELVVDHVNCRPWDNYVDNLEAVTPKENTRRAIRNSCKSYIMPWDKAVEMCTDLAYPNPLSIQQASKKYDVPVHVPGFILQGLTWKEIADEYNLVYPDYNIKKKTPLTSEMIKDADDGMSKEDFGIKYRFGGRKLSSMFKKAQSVHSNSKKSA